ncbi:MAG: hypothetical protein R3272_14840 [Candidatus Promineifilaceae bacterium]|nr:hypothetical protein [Candidatus Promineifilaceae bacterium]
MSGSAVRDEESVPAPGRDTQWPRYEVFQRSREGGPVHNIGTVHAPDAEVALQNARDVFVRRPQTHTLWVAPARSILTRTREQLEEEPDWRQKMVTEEVPVKAYFVFHKNSQRRSMHYVTLCGEVEATTPVEALGKALDRYDEGESFVWWIVPADALARSEDEEIESMFAPAEDKEFRLPNQYRTRTLMREAIREAGEDKGQS